MKVSLKKIKTLCVQLASMFPFCRVQLFSWASHPSDWIAFLKTQWAELQDNSQRLLNSR